MNRSWLPLGIMALGGIFFYFSFWLLPPHYVTDVRQGETASNSLAWITSFSLGILMLGGSLCYIYMQLTNIILQPTDFVFVTTILLFQIVIQLLNFPAIAWVLLILCPIYAFSCIFHVYKVYGWKRSYWLRIGVFLLPFILWLIIEPLIRSYAYFGVWQF